MKRSYSMILTVTLFALMAIKGTNVVWAAPNRSPSPQQHAPAQHVSPQQHFAQPHAVAQPHVNRTPSLSRADPQFNHPAITRGPTPAVHAPSPSRVPVSNTPLQRNGMQALQRPDHSPSRDMLKQKLDTIKQQGGTRQLSSQKIEAMKVTLPNRRSGEKHAASAVQDRFRHDHPGSSNWFNDQFFASHQLRPNYNYHKNFWNNRTRWRDISNLLGWGWSSPIYYDDGYPVDLSSDDDDNSDTQVYIPGNGTDDQASTQEDALGSWTPIGNFAAGKDATNASYSNMFVQLAINKEGDLAGTYYNATSDQTHLLSGFVDRETQEASWDLSDVPDSPVMTTGIYNLTQDVVPIQVHFQNNVDQSWVLIRLTE